MNVKRRAISVTLAGDVKVDHHLFYHEDRPSRNLLVILPGRGYLNSHPVLHYLTKMATLNSYDVLQVNYSFQVIPNVVVSNPQLAQEVQLALDGTLNEAYERVCIAGKSMGTPLAVTAIHAIEASEKSLILLTPIGGSTNMVGDLPTLAIIGTADEAYNASLVAGDASKSNLKWSIYEGLNHGLEYPDDWLKSAEVLPRIVAECEQFLRC